MRARADGVAPLPARVALLVALVAVLAGIWVLTGQQSEDTMELSEGLVRVVQDALGLIDHDGTVADDAAAGEGDDSSGVSDDASSGADDGSADDGASSAAAGDDDRLAAAGSLAAMYATPTVTPTALQARAGDSVSFTVDAPGAVAYEWRGYWGEEADGMGSELSHASTHEATLTFTLENISIPKLYRCLVTYEDGSQQFSEVAAVETIDNAQTIHYTRFAAHVAEYALLAAVAALCALAWAGRRVHPHPLLANVIWFCVACSLADGVHRCFVPERDIDLLDFGFDAIGYVLGASLVFLVVWRLCCRRDARRHREALG